jgi:hypothetical protein
MYHELSRRTKARRRVGARAEEPALLPVRVVEDATSGSAPLELILAGGYRLRIGGDFDAMLLRKLLEVLAPC